MSKVIAIASGKGGVGKSTVCCHLARALASAGQATVIIELDAGLRGFDIFLNINDTVYDLDDVLNGICTLSDVLQTSPDNEKLSLIPAPTKYRNLPTANELKVLCNTLGSRYENILIDLPAGYHLTEIVSKVADLFLIVVTQDLVSIRDASMFASFLRNECKTKASLRLVVNRVRKDFLKKGIAKNLDSIIDQTQTQLIGVILEDDNISIKTLKGKPLKTKSLSYKIFDAICSRINGETKRLMI